MPFVKAGPNQYLVVGRGGSVESRGAAVQTWLRPGSVYALVPAAKQEATFEFTQETKDGIPLRFKGIVVYRITDPALAARLFDFGSTSGTRGVEQITTLLAHVCLGELRHAVSHMTMTECIEQRKTTLSQIAADALRAASGDDHVARGGEPAGLGDAAGEGDPAGWGLSIDVVQVAQVFIVDAELRRQLEAEVRGEIRSRSDQAAVRAAEETRLAEMASEARVQDRKLASDREALRRREELELADLARERRMQAEAIATARQALELERGRFRVEMEAETDRIATGTPVRLERIARDREVLEQELELRRLQRALRAVEVEQELLLDRGRQELRREILPLEQAPEIVEAAAGVLHGTNLTIYGDGAGLVGQVAPVLELLGRAVRGSMAAAGAGASAGETPGAGAPDLGAR